MVGTILVNFHQRPQRLARLPRGRPCFHPWAGPSAPVQAGLLSCCGCPALCAAGLAGEGFRAGSPAAGQTATTGAVLALASAAALAGRPLLPEGGWSSLGSPTPASLSWLPAPASRHRRRCAPSASWLPLWWRLRSGGPRRRPRSWSRRRSLVPARGTRADQKTQEYLGFWLPRSGRLLRRHQ
jgi:hypothetical protein